MNDELEQPAYEVHLTLDQNSIRAPIHRVLIDSSNNVALSLLAVDQYKTDEMPQLPTNGLFRYTINPPDPKQMPQALDELKQAFRQWILKVAFGEFIVGVTGTIQSARFYCEVATYFGPGPHETKAEEFNERMGALREQALKGDIPTMLDRLEAKLTSPLDLREHIQSINTARNCLEHRRGVVTKADTNNAEQDALVVKWRRPELFYEKDGEEIILDGPKVIEGPTTVKLRYIDEKRIFKLGERIEFTVDEFNLLMFTCTLFCEDIIGKLPKLPEPPSP